MMHGFRSIDTGVILGSRISKRPVAISTRTGPPTTADQFYNFVAANAGMLVALGVLLLLIGLALAAVRATRSH